jgi:hypothetical protein
METEICFAEEMIAWKKWREKWRKERETLDEHFDGRLHPDTYGHSHAKRPLPRQLSIDLTRSCPIGRSSGDSTDSCNGGDKPASIAANFPCFEEAVGRSDRQFCSYTTRTAQKTVSNNSSLPRKGLY